MLKDWANIGESGEGPNSSSVYDYGVRVADCRWWSSGDASFEKCLTFGGGSSPTLYHIGVIADNNGRGGKRVSVSTRFSS